MEKSVDGCFKFGLFVGIGKLTFMWAQKRLNPSEIGGRCDHVHIGAVVGNTLNTIFLHFGILSYLATIEGAPLTKRPKERAPFLPFVLEGKEILGLCNTRTLVSN
ncbi:hypothetical protein B0F90DRAFT_1393436 [Multifurca ochricompacta]|uniref:Uncharacterized protein n=1 Tax=Multifurca ochricompacta TaxID=376703 RepID=A0AAD4QK45_9AGAM|nr:hypothetical protein B0F90DRAFT_1393436 [Multifurca ochricompacta]